MSEQTEWNCHNCDADNSVCDCKQEPVAWAQRRPVLGLSISLKRTVYHTMPLYTNPSNIRRLSIDEQYKFIDENVKILGTGDALDLINRVMDACGIPKGGE